MPFDVHMGVPEMADVWKRLEKGAAKQTLDRDDRELAKKFAKAVKHLGSNPFHPGLQSHEIDSLSQRYGHKVFESYLENNTPAAGRMFWVYGPNRQQITVIGLEPHPEDSKNSAYNRVKLSALPEVKPKELPEKQKRRGAPQPQQKRGRHRR